MIIMFMAALSLCLSIINLTVYHKPAHKPIPAKVQVSDYIPTDNRPQWRIQNFPEVGAPTLQGGANIRFCQIFPKTAWNWKNLDPRGGGARIQNFTM